MVNLVRSWLVGLSPLAVIAHGDQNKAADACPETPELSCSGSAASACCVPTAGLFLFKQRFEPDVGDGGQWGIDGLEVLR